MTAGTEQAALLPCPFCGEADTKIDGDDNDGGPHRYFVACMVCGVQTYRLDTEAEAIAAWNRRASPGGELAPCPFCGGELQHIESWARSFEPNRLYHEYRHPANDCPVIYGHTARLWSFTDDPAPRLAFVAAWNRRFPDARVAVTGETNLQLTARLMMEELSVVNPNANDDTMAMLARHFTRRAREAALRSPAP